MDKKIYNVGLVLNSTVEEYKDFLDKYVEYIDSIYFSLPLGERFHSRIKIRDQFRIKSVVDTFWKILKLIKTYDIKLELVLNTYRLNDNDIEISSRELKRHNIEVDSIAILDEYYDAANKCFPKQKKVFSYNNGIRSVEDLKKISNKYDSYVLGSNLMRDLSVKKYIVDELKSEVILMVNNGCSFNCHFCRNSNLCRTVFENNLKHKSINELYAEQSFFPSELKEELVKNYNYNNLIKISCRSSNLNYLYKCMDSYIDCEEEKYIKIAPNNYNLWCRLAVFGDYYEKLDYNRIKLIKKGM